MSNVYSDLGAEYVTYAGTTETFSATIIDPDTGAAMDLTDTTKFANGNANARIVKPNNNIIGIVAITYNDRTNGIVQFTVDDTIATNNNLGNYIVEIILGNNSNKPILQQNANFNIKRTR